YLFCSHYCVNLIFFFFNHPAPTDIYTLSLHDALPICLTPSAPTSRSKGVPLASFGCDGNILRGRPININNSGIDEKICADLSDRSEEHTSELQSRGHLVCRLLLEKKKKNTQKEATTNI